MVFCYGLPSHPYQHSPAKVEGLIEEGFVLFYPNYVGTWGSYGTMSWENCVSTVLQSIDFLKGGKGENAYNRSSIAWEVKDIVLVGGSFGGSVALVAGAKSKEIKNIVSVAAPTDWRDHSRIAEEPGEPIDELFNSIKRGWNNLWRIPSKKEWDRLATGKVDLNPIDYIKELRDKNILLIHGELDNIVAVKRSKLLYEQLKTGKGKTQATDSQGRRPQGQRRGRKRRRNSDGLEVLGIVIASRLDTSRELSAFLVLLSILSERRGNAPSWLVLALHHLCFSISS